MTAIHDAGRAAAPGGVIGERQMVASGHPLAVDAALRMLAEGGSAVDAAIAADAVLGVVEPMATGIGGDLLATLVAPDGSATCYNGTGRAPAALSVDLVSRLPGQRIAERHALSVTTPGVVRGWHDLHRAHGRLAWSRILAPAIRVARNGFAVAPVAAREWALFDAVLHADPNCAALYRAGRAPQAGERYANPELAGLLEAVAVEGPDAFYLGAPARAAARANQQLGGVLSAADFEWHRGDFATPLSTRFRGLTVLECPPNTHGLAVLHALDELEPQALDAADPMTHVAMAGAMARAMAHAKKTVADPAGNTVCTVVVDEQGLAVTLMTSVFKRFGSAIAVPGCGFVLQNRGFGFAEPGHINGPGPGKRPYHTVVPGAALKDGRFHAGFGVVGGAMQPQGHVQLLVRLAAWGEPLQAAIDAPRWRLEGTQALAIEDGTPAPVREALRGAGYTDPVGAGELGGRSDFGGAQVVLRSADGRLVGGSDPRKDGLARGL
ncbi:Gamma-glutamyltransferase [Leptothrix cholodnii SP-6]|uniref:Gamma-glutamyltransferase n=1 Tax=Leptothrix cholodnii (strain ATCC 51168 / LMG 8142 / SP-6) TaxID=395495 RepID=B1Y0C7_LEPCP|nr:gamma-glutamyltransferase [Leptothrix cholodnii]ACB36606.1 Gamma-glutamyltransferase [Leptothrix cholodnii SP-6]